MAQGHHLCHQHLQLRLRSHRDQLQSHHQFHRTCRLPQPHQDVETTLQCSHPFLQKPQLHQICSFGRQRRLWMVVPPRVLLPVLGFGTSPADDHQLLCEEYVSKTTFDLILAVV
uniref:Uncharacterized protein n=1 Tax=Cucumis sativus TaxID=3659 RepID=A0A0A0LNJ5_CUCSA